MKECLSQRRSFFLRIPSKLVWFRGGVSFNIKWNLPVITLFASKIAIFSPFFQPL